MSKGRKRKAKRSVQADSGRRKFLMALGATAAAAAVSGEATADSDRPTDEAKSKGYHETQHIRDYYDSARI